MPLVRLGVDHEDKGVVLLNLLHRTLGVEWVDDNLAGIETGLRWDRLAGVFGRAREREGLGKVERGVLPDLLRLVRVDLLYENRPSESCSSDTPLDDHGGLVLTPRRVALAAAEAFAEGLPALEFSAV